MRSDDRHPLRRPDDANATSEHGRPAARFSRRTLFGGAAAIGAGTVLGTSCADDQPPPLSGDVDNDEFGFVPPATAPPPGVQRYLTRSEMRSLDALAARLLPGSPDDPGASEAGAANFIDAMLAEFADFDEPTYLQGPFVGERERWPELPEGVEQLSDDELARYGFQSSLTPQQLYRRGLAALDRAASEMVGGPFADAHAEQQDTVVTALADGRAPGFDDEPSADHFFDRVREDVIHAVFADPIYGGNRDMIGWKLIGYPGAQRAWTPVEMQVGPNRARRVQGLHELHATHPGRPADPAVHPIQEPDPAVHP